MSITALSALDLAARLHAGSLKITQTLDACFAAISPNGNNSFAALSKDHAYARAIEIQARLDAGDVRSPLAGVPIATDDRMCTRGIATAAGSKALEGFVPPYNATVIEKINAADMILLGKTATDEFGMGSSICGAALAVQAGEAPIALGCDTGGAMRRSAAKCGLAGLRPTYGAVSRYGLIAHASSMDQVGPVARNATDCAALFDIIKGKDEHDSTSVESHGCVSPTNNPNIGPLPRIDYALPTYEILASAEASSNLSRYDGIKYGHASENAQTLRDTYVLSRSEGFGTQAKRRVMLGNFVLDAGQFDTYYTKALKARRLIQQALFAALEEYDVLTAPAEDESALVLASLAGLPALALPDGRQLVGRAFGERALLGVATDCNSIRR